MYVTLINKSKIVITDALGYLSQNTIILLRKMIQKHCCNREKAKKQLRWKPIYSNKDTLLKIFEWNLANQDKIMNKFGVSHRAPREAVNFEYGKEVF